jgi:hypothetical protein
MKPLKKWRVTYALPNKSTKMPENCEPRAKRAARARSSDGQLQCARLLGQGFKAQYSLI